MNIDCPNKSDVIRAINKLEDMISEMAEELRQDYQLYSSAEGADDLLSQIKQYINYCDKPIYKIITMNIEEHIIKSYEMFGWYHELDKAIQAVESNSCDLQDSAFNYALICRSYQGPYGIHDEELRLYKWNEDAERWEICEQYDECGSLIFN